MNSLKQHVRQSFWGMHYQFTFLAYLGYYKYIIEILHLGMYNSSMNSLIEIVKNNIFEFQDIEFVI